MSSGLRTSRNSEVGLVARWALHVALIAALGAFVVAWDERSVLLLLIPLALAPALRWFRAPRFLVVLLALVSHGALAALFALAVLSRQLRLVPEDLGLRTGVLLGWVLAVLAVAFLLGHRIWPVATTLLPAIVGVLVASGLKPGVSLFPYFAVVSAVALWTFAFVRGGPRRLGVPLGAFLLTAAVVSGLLLRALPWAQPFVEQAVAQTFAQGTTGLSAESRLGEFGSLARSDRVVLRVWSSRPQYLRAYVFTRFDGRQWSATDRHTAWGNKPLLPVASPRDEASVLSDAPGNLFLLDQDDTTAEPGIVETRILQSVVTDWPLLVPPGPRLVRAPTPYLLKSREGELRWPPYEPARLYAVGQEAVARARTNGGLSARAEALGLPVRLDPRFRVLAGTLATDGRTDRARLDNTVRWLHTHLAYTLEVGEFKTTDPLAEFLFEKKAGYCEYFASAAAVLLRLQGIPTRYVKGFNVGPHNLVEGGYGVSAHHLVRESDAHAWVEAYVAGEGWVEADPTPPDEFAALHRYDPGPLDRIGEAAQVHTSEVWALLMHEGFGGLLTAIEGAARHLLDGLWRHPLPVAGGLFLLVAVLSRGVIVGALRRLRLRRWARRERRAALPGRLEPLLAAVERHWERRGRGRPATRGLREHLYGLPPAFLSRAERQACTRVVEACYRAAYGGSPPSAPEIARLERDVASLG